MSFLTENIIRRMALAPRAIAIRTPRTFSTSFAAQRTATETVKDAAKKVDRVVSDKIVDGIDAGGMFIYPFFHLIHATSTSSISSRQLTFFSLTAAVGSKIKQSAEDLTSGDTAAKAQELKGEALGKAQELKGEAFGKAQELKGDAKSTAEQAKGKANAINEQAKGKAAAANEQTKI